ncbi:MAG TPA: acyl carrier protein [Saprospiraceae bacterium]|nr:acyl carrier protein [Saprospiraceae bacterium]
MSTIQFDKVAIENWLIDWIAKEMGINKSEIQTGVPFSSFNLDSIVVVTMAVDLEAWLKKRVDPTVFWEYETIDELATWLERHYVIIE